MVKIRSTARATVQVRNISIDQTDANAFSFESQALPFELVGGGELQIRVSYRSGTYLGDDHEGMLRVETDVGVVEVLLIGRTQGPYRPDVQEGGAPPEDTTGPARQVAASSGGPDSACALVDTGDIYCIDTLQAAPAKIEGLPAMKQVDLSPWHSCAVSEKGQVYCWGDNLMGALGRGTASTVPGEEVDPTPALVTAIDLVKEVKVSFGYTCALQETGAIWCWGGVPYGAGGTQVDPIKIEGVPAATSIEVAHNHSCALAEGKVYCWGQNFSGQLGDGSETDRTDMASPRQVPGLEDVVEISAHFLTTCARTASGEGSCWGKRLDGPLGYSSPFDATPQPLALTDVRGLGVGSAHACAIHGVERKLSCWGSNERGELGNGTRESSATPVAVPGLIDVTGVAPSLALFTCAIADGELYCWGTGTMPLGGTTRSPSAADSSLPVKIQLMP